MAIKRGHHDAHSIDTAYEVENQPAMAFGYAEPIPNTELPPLNLKQWLQVLSAFVVFLNTWGLLLAFGAFQTHYQQVLLVEKSSSDIAWIATTCAFILLFSGVITGPLFDYGYLRPLLLIGSLLEVFGLMMLSLCTQYYQVFLAQGICIGIGGGMLYIPSIAAAAASLQEKRRAKFIGLVSSATGVGGVIYPIMFRQLVSSIGFPWAVRAIAFVLFGTYLFSYPILWYKPAKSIIVRRWIDISAFTDTAFMLSAIAAFFSGFAYYLPLLYLPIFAETGIPGFNDADLAFYLLSIVNGASIIGRLAAGGIAAKIGPLETCAAAVAGSALILFCWMAVHSTAGVIAWSVFWGLSSSVIVAMPGAFLPQLSPTLQVLGTRTGMYWAGIGLGLLIGSPIGGALVNIQSPPIEWWHLQLIDAMFMFAGAVCGFFSMMIVRRRGRVVAQSK